MSSNGHGVTVLCIHIDLESRVDLAKVGEHLRVRKAFDHLQGEGFRLSIFFTTAQHIGALVGDSSDGFDCQVGGLRSGQREVLQHLFKLGYTGKRTIAPCSRLSCTNRKKQGIYRWCSSRQLEVSGKAPPGGAAAGNWGSVGGVLTAAEDKGSAW